MNVVKNTSMKINNSYKYLGFCIGLSILAIDVSPSQAVTLEWSLTFSDNTGAQVGGGGFSYDDAKEVVVRSPMPYSDAYIGDKGALLRSDFEPPFPGLWRVNRYANPLTSFTATLPGRTWSLQDGGAVNWFDPSFSSPLGSFGCSRTSCSTAGQWFLGSPTGFAPGQFAMFNGTQLSDGSYEGSFISAPISGLAGSLISGTWRANAVPEPTTVLGAVVFGVGYGASKMRRSRQKLGQKTSSK
jgi:hypothetical protein